MGGQRYSEIRLQREQADKIRAIQGIAALRATLIGLQAELKELLGTATAGIRETFQDQVRSALRWDGRVQNATAETADDGRDIGALKATARQLAGLASSGQRLVEQIGLSFTKGGDALSQQLAAQLARTRALVASHRDVCAMWFGGQVRQWQAEWQRANDEFDQENYPQVIQRLNAIEAGITAARAQSEQLAAKHQTRMFLLKAARQVCCNLGMHEVEKPHYERAGDLTSRILLRVRSPDRGEIAFAFTLDGVHSDSAPGRCLSDLGKLSGLLSQDYGIGTEFRETAGPDRPEMPQGEARTIPEEQECSSAQA